MSQSTPSENPNSDKPVLVDFSLVAREVKLSQVVVEDTVELLDQGNTIPFITRFRKDLTGGLNEKQILEIKRVIGQHRAVAERKSFILKAIESQGALTEELKSQIASAVNGRLLEDLYLPFKPQKQSRALVAKQQGLEPLVEEILQAKSADVDLAARAIQFVRVDKGLASVDEVIRGVTDLLVERFAANSELKNELRQIVRKTGVLTSKGIEEPVPETRVIAMPDDRKNQSALPEVSSPQADIVAAVEQPIIDSSDLTVNSESVASEFPDEVRSAEGQRTTTSVSIDQFAHQLSSATEEFGELDSRNAENANSEATSEPIIQTASESVVESIEPATETMVQPLAEPSLESVAKTEMEPVAETASLESVSDVVATKANLPVASESQKSQKKKKKKKSTPDPFKDYHDFKQPLKSLSHHQFLAISRGERAEKLKIKLQADDDQLNLAAINSSVPAEHPFSEFLKKCAHESLIRVLLPSIEREIRRELTEAAEKHATEVFASNLRNLLLQPPLRNGRVLAIDPGFRSGCGVVVLDEFGNVLEHGQIYVVGNQSKRDESKAKIAEWVTRLKIDVIAIGTGAACRQAEQMISDLIAESLADTKVRYVMVNEAGASVYSISEIGREELPDLSPAIRSAVSIGRRLQDPLSEFVKISPPNIGVGMYQHDVKAKHLVDSLDDIVELCVNQVGVNVNSASLSLLKFVSGLNALTARRLVEHRQKFGGFKNRQQLKEVSGIGDATFIQAAGFLRIHDGDNPLDSTSIHPESYPLAEKIIAFAQTSKEELFPRTQARQPEEISAEANPPGASDRLPDIGKLEISPAPSESDADQPRSGQDDNVQPVGAQLSDSELSDSELSNSELSNSLQADIAAAEISSSSSDADFEDLTQKFEARKQAMQRLSELDINAIAYENNAGRLLVRDILLALKKPAYDPRDRVAKPIFRRGILKIDDLKPEMQLEGQVVNVVDFGVFIDIGLGESSLVHVSQLSHRYVADPHRFYAVGDVIRVWVSEIDPARRRVKLTAIQPGSKPAPKRKHDRGNESRRERRSEQTSSPEQSTSSSPTPSKPGRFESTRTGSSRPGSARSGSATGDVGQPSRSQRFDQQKSKQRFDHKRDQGKDSRPRHQSRPPRPQMPAPPITDGMIKGSEPMRSFSDLMQFVKQKPQKDDEKT